MDARARLIRRSDMVACRVAFIDCKMPGSTLKENYSLIGPGVTQSSEQVVNIVEPHGFSLGVAAMPPGTTNNLHVHYTAEVFMVFSGTWLFRWGADGKDGEIIGVPGDVVSIPTWIFRGFSNVGKEDGWIFTALGGDDTGGILWHPSILRTAAEHGLYLTRDNMLVDTEAGAPKPAEAELITPLDDATVQGLRRVGVGEMLRRVVKSGDRAWSARALLDSVLPGHTSELAPVIGHGMSEDLDHVAQIMNPHGFSMEWLRIAPGHRIGPFKLTEQQVLIVFAGAVEIALEGADALRAEAREVFSAPPDLWRTLTAVGDITAEIAVITAGDQKKRITWAPEIVRSAAQAGYGIDPAGYLAQIRLLPPSIQAHAA